MIESGLAKLSREIITLRSNSANMNLVISRKLNSQGTSYIPGRQLAIIHSLIISHLITKTMEVELGTARRVLNQPTNRPTVGGAWETVISTANLLKFSHIQDRLAFDIHIEYSAQNINREHFKKQHNRGTFNSAHCGRDVARSFVINRSWGNAEAEDFTDRNTDFILQSLRCIPSSELPEACAKINRSLTRYVTKTNFSIDTPKAVS